MTLDLQTLSDRIAIEERLNFYAHFIDTRQFHRVAAEVFTEDADVDFAGLNVVGRAAIDSTLKGLTTGIIGTSHNISNVFIEVNGDDARMSCRIMAWHWFEKPGGDKLAPTDLLAVGGYQDRVRRTPEGWRIYHRRGLSFGTGIGIGAVPDDLRPIMEATLGRVADWPG